VSCPQRYSDGAYVLGALHPAERAEFEQHLARCPGCAAAVGQLAPLPGLLGRVDPALLGQEVPDPARLPRLLEVVTRLRRRQARRHRWRLAVAATSAALVAAAGAAVWAGAVQPDQPPPVAEAPLADEPPAGAVEMRAVEVTSPVVAQVSVDRSVGGSTVWMRCRYPDIGYEEPPRMFRLVAVSTDGTVEQLGSWRAGPGDQVELTGLTRLGADLARIELRGADDTTLLVHEV
jgi:hypothetical protein